MNNRKKAVVVGGSNGIGLAITKGLTEKGYFVEICDRAELEDGILDKDCYHYNYCDLLDFKAELFSSLSADENVECLVITAGIGRVADFQYHHIAEIEKMLTIDAVSTIKIFRIFYDRLLGDKTFYAGVMGSISGWMSTPSASVYAAAKAAVVRFAESVNIELEVYGSANRILDVSPASFKGSRFYGGKNELSLVQPLAEDILGHLFARETQFIPQYEDVYKAVLERYHNDPHEYGLHSFSFKKQSGRLDNCRRVKLGYVSGDFNIMNLEQVELLQGAKAQCDYLIVGIYNPGQLGENETENSFEYRKRIVSSCKYVDMVVKASPEDTDAWDILHFDRLFAGAACKDTFKFQQYENYFKDKEVEIIYDPYSALRSLLLEN